MDEAPWAAKLLAGPGELRRGVAGEGGAWCRGVPNTLLDSCSEVLVAIRSGVRGGGGSGATL